MQLSTTLRVFLLGCFLLLLIDMIQGRVSSPPFFGIPRGGAADAQTNNQAFGWLANVLESEFPDSSRDKLTKALLRLASSQQTFKKLDGMAHEAYQRTHSGDDIDTSVAGRAQRSAARLAATAEGLLACELVELVQTPSHLVGNETSVNRQLIFNSTAADNTTSVIKLGDSKLSILVWYEETYDRGAGLEHGSIAALADSDSYKTATKGRLLIVLGDAVSDNLVDTLEILNQPPKRIKLSSGLVTNEVASVQPALYQTAGQLLEVMEPHLRQYNQSAVHFVGRSLAGGVASLAATMLDGTIPLPKSKKKRRKKTEKAAIERVETTDSVENEANETKTDQEPKLEPLNGLGRARSSALSLGAPPCLSSNVLAAYCTSFIYGDDIVSRTTHESLDHLSGRIQKTIKGGFIGKNIGLMTDTLSLTMSGLKSHAHGSEGEEIKLSIPGRAYLVRPRRLGGSCSIHEVGNMKKGGREALRANLLWQLHDILLSKSMWKHHELESYIQGLDRVQLRTTAEGDLL
jgi:hypothetical protein